MRNPLNRRRVSQAGPAPGLFAAGMPETAERPLAAMPRLRPAADSGMVSGFRPAQHVKGGAIQRAIQSFTGAFARLLGRPPARQTTEQGASQTSTPSITQYQLIQLRYERRAKIADCRQMEIDDPRARKSVAMFAREAVRKGCTIEVTGKREEGLGQRAQAALAGIQTLVNPKVESWARMLLVEGELFVQVVAAGAEIVDVKRMPAAGMERITDDTDEFIDPARAFEQVDELTQQTVAPFALWQIVHERWNHVDGERYGEPELTSVRRMSRLLRLMEDAQVVRRMTRAAMQRIWNIGTKESPAGEGDLDEFKAKNGFVEGRAEIYDPNNAAVDYFGLNETLSASVISADEHVSDIQDISKYENVYASGLPTPAALYNLGASDVNRDVLEDQRAEWLKQTVALSDAMSRVVRQICDRTLLLAGILPETVDYSIHFSESSIETPSDIVARVRDLRQNTVGTGRNALPDPLVSRRKALQLLAEITDTQDVDAELKEIEKERADDEADAQAAAPAAVAQPAHAGVRPLDALATGRNGNGHALVGRGRIGQNGRYRPGDHPACEACFVEPRGRPGRAE